MRYSQTFIPTTREVPAEAEIASHRLMIRAGFMRKVASGAYTYLPLGWRSLRKIMAIVREEMDAAGALELQMPALQPKELWARTGRDVDYGDTMFRFTDRHGRVNVLAPTAEEVVTTLVAAEINSYKQLPVNLYQISPKFRDEFRPRFGVLRSREFIMKDAYSFDISLEGLEATYRKMYDAYCRIFTRCGLRYVIVEAESGPIGGSASHEFMIPCDNGEDIIVHTADDSYAANIEKAEVDPLPKADPLDAPPPEDVHTPDVGTIDAVCEFLHTKPAEMIKTLIYSAGERTVVALVRGDHETNEAKLSHVVDADHLDLADEATIQRVTGAAVGFAGPVGLADKIDTLVVDHGVAAMALAATGANRTDYHTINVAPGRDFPLDGDNVIVADIRNATEGDTHKGQPLQFSRGIEIGHVFKLGTKYSDALGATVLDDSGATRATLMGCYGIGINRILAGAIELANDKDGCILPVSIAPYEIEVIQLNSDSPPVVAEATRIYDELTAAGAEVLLDDRDARPGVKFKDADLLGIPLRVVVGDRGIKEGAVEVKRRTDDKPTAVPVADAVAETLRILAELKQAVAC